MPQRLIGCADRGRAETAEGQSVHAAAHAAPVRASPGFSCVVVGMDGAVYHWVIKENHRVRENVMKACTYTCAVADDSKSSAEELAPLYAVGSDSRLKCLTGNGPEMTVLEVAPPPPHGAPVAAASCRQSAMERTECGGAAQSRAQGWAVLVGRCRRRRF